MYVIDNEIIIVNCENDQESSTHNILEGVRKISINEACKGYATRELLITSTNAENNILDFILTSIIAQQDYRYVTLDLYTMINKNVINIHISDLNLISKTHLQLLELSNIINKR